MCVFHFKTLWKKVITKQQSKVLALLEVLKMQLYQQ